VVVPQIHRGIGNVLERNSRANKQVAARGSWRAIEPDRASPAPTFDQMMTIGVILTDASARPSFISARAARMIAESNTLKLDHTGLVATMPLAAQELRDAILAVSADAAVEGRRLRLQQPSRRLPLLLTLVRVFRLDSIEPGVHASQVVIFMKEPDAAPAIDRFAITEAFHLTRRETDVAILLAGGLGPDEIAAKLGLGIGTVRHHLKRIFDKSGAHSQGALVALIRGFDQFE
jgi:DNA-binding CsgD family transcriptional regulator